MKDDAQCCTSKLISDSALLQPSPPRICLPRTRVIVGITPACDDDRVPSQFIDTNVVVTPTLCGEDVENLTHTRQGTIQHQHTKELVLKRATEVPVGANTPGDSDVRTSVVKPLDLWKGYVLNNGIALPQYDAERVEQPRSVDAGAGRVCASARWLIRAGLVTRAESSQSDNEKDTQSLERNGHEPSDLRRCLTGIRHTCLTYMQRSSRAV